jgi:hypothetical protein
MLTLMMMGLKGRSMELERWRFRPWPWRRWSGKMAKFAMYGASQLARVDEENEEKMAVTGVSTARLGTASVAGEDERPAN